jgi:hypothetical protein
MKARRYMPTKNALFFAVALAALILLNAHSANAAPVPSGSKVFGVDFPSSGEQAEDGSGNLIKDSAGNTYVAPADGVSMYSNTDTYSGPDNGISPLPEESTDDQSGGGGVSGFFKKVVGGVGDAVKGIVGTVTKGPEGLAKQISGWVFGAIGGWIYAHMMHALNWVLNLLIQMMNMPIDVAHVRESTLAGQMIFSNAHVHTMFSQIRMISQWLLIVFIVITGARTVIGGVTGTGMAAARSLVPRVLFAVIGGYFALYICQWILDINYAMCSDVLKVTNIFECPPINTFYGGMLSNGGSSTAMVILLAGWIMVFALVILYIFYLVRLVGIYILVALAPMAFACYVLDEAQFVTSSWFKMFLGLTFIPFFHCVIIAMSKLAMFSGMDGLTAALLSLVYLYLLFKVPEMFMKSAIGSTNDYKAKVTTAVTQAGKRAAAAIA